MALLLYKFIYLYNKGVLAVSNVDDYFIQLKNLGVEEVVVDKDEMNIIVQFYLTNVTGDKNGNQAEILREGKLDRLFGINLVTKQ